MEPIDWYLRAADRVGTRESFLEKEMLDSDVRHLEVRTTFFDKLTVLSSGSIALGITFLGSAYQNEVLRCEIVPCVRGLFIALALILASLIFSVTHNFLTSRAVTLLSRQIEAIYHANHEVVLHASSDYSYKGGELPQEIARKVKKWQAAAEKLGGEKERLMPKVQRVGLLATILLFVGYSVGLCMVVLIFSK